ncbi:hypothetical protein N7474_004396 [Penicillium riverlandense]|uniref:uncharacterized protein n=1 Tax=Penicillium riverlandense TaxID=1903569 RepID=UPI002546A9AD|nr:uncharacterized protein N7474_004396 [Penicillium riverlandense]KAJ5818805.1 hypothetical protein N7474_004396 [Penicillium riverlandense]
MPRKPTPASDEQKPRCANCEVKGFACKYGTDLSFVPPQSGLVSGGGQAYTNITFVDDTPLASNLTANKETVKDQQPPPQPGPNDIQNLQNTRGTPGPPPVEVKDVFMPNALDASAGPSIIQNIPGLLIGDQERPTRDTRLLNSSPHLTYSVSTFSDQQGTLSSPSAGGNLETALLRHFRYHISPWIDVGDPSCAFGLQTLLLSRTSRPVQLAILALSAAQRLAISSFMNNEDSENGPKFRKEAETSLMIEPESSRHAGRALLMLQDFLTAGPQKWRDLFMHLRGFHSIDLAASIMSLQSPMVPFRSFLRRDGSPIHSLPQPPPQSHSVHRVYKHVLCLLGHCLALIYGGPETATPAAAGSPELSAFPSLRQSHFLSQWTFLWSDCQKWYNDRPVDAEQIVDIRGGEADKIDPEHCSSFPILIYTTPLALAANAVYHITSLLLLTHKPRLLKSLPGPRCITSHIWHAQSIAGIAASNDSPEQWDPILVASLLLIAREMTHESQQSVLLERLRRITATTGIKLDCEIETLRSDWNMARYDEDGEDEVG